MDNTLTPNPEIIVNETIDGRPVDRASSPRPRRKSASAAKATPTVGHPDRYIWGIYIMLLIISCIEVFSASSSQVSGANVYKPLIDHVKFLAAGFVLILALQRIHYKWFKFYATAVFVICMGALVYATYFGADINGAKRAIDLKVLSLQPPEMMKLAMVLFLAKIMGTNQRPGGVNNKGVIYSVVVVTIAAGVLWKNGLTNAAMVMAISIAMFLIGGIEWKKLGIIALIYGALFGIVLVTKYSDHNATPPSDDVVAVQTAAPSDRSQTHTSRIKKYMAGVDAGDAITDDNRQVMFSHFALANGGIIGQGPGNSRESARLPLAFSDYIYSIIVEDTGFVGGCFLLILYLCLLGRAGRIASKCRRAFPALLIMGCAVMIVLQALVHMTIAVGLGPVSGQPLPFISKGGTSIMVMSAAIGMMLSVSRYALKGQSTKREEKAELNDLPEDLQAENPTMLE